MGNSDFDIYQFALLDHELLRLPGVHDRSLRLFRDSVVRPSVQSIVQEIEKNNQSEDPSSVFLAPDLEELFQATIKGYVLTVHSMWERGFRSLLINLEQGLNREKDITPLYKAHWSSSKFGLQSHFQRLTAIPIEAFDSYQDLDLLQNLGNAIRHGDGDSSERLYKLAPSLWPVPFASESSLFPTPMTPKSSRPTSKAPPFSTVTLNEDILEQLIESVEGFWQDIEYLRCNSFRNKHVSVARHLVSLSEERYRRRNMRIWTAS